MFIIIVYLALYVVSVIFRLFTNFLEYSEHGKIQSQYLEKIEIENKTNYQKKKSLRNCIRVKTLYLLKILNKRNSFHSFQNYDTL